MSLLSVFPIFRTLLRQQQNNNNNLERERDRNKTCLDLVGGYHFFLFFFNHRMYNTNTPGDHLAISPDGFFVGMWRAVIFIIRRHGFKFRHGTNSGSEFPARNGHVHLQRSPPPSCQHASDQARRQLHGIFIIQL